MKGIEYIELKPPSRDWYQPLLTLVISYHACFPFTAFIFFNLCAGSKCFCFLSILHQTSQHKSTRSYLPLSTLFTTSMSTSPTTSPTRRARASNRSVGRRRTIANATFIILLAELWIGMDRIRLLDLREHRLGLADLVDVARVKFGGRRRNSGYPRSLDGM